MKKLASKIVRAAVCVATLACSSTSVSANQWVQIAEDGSVSGRVLIPAADDGLVAISNGEVTLISQQGQSFTQEIDATGRFSFADVGPGVYSLAAVSENSVACCALHAVPRDTPGAAELPASFDVVSAKVSRVDIKSALLRYLPPRLLNESVSIESAKIPVLSSSDALLAPYRVLSTNGGMNGQINAAGALGGVLDSAPESVVMIFAEGQQVATTTADASGRFRVNELAPGEYALVAIGSRGVAAVGFELVERGALKQASADITGIKLVQDLSFNPCDCFAVQAAPVPEVIETSGPLPADAHVISDQLISETVVDAGFATPLGGGGSFAGGGGGFGGGGFGGGVGGGGGILGLAAAGGIIAAIAASDDDDAAVSPASPAAP